MPDIQNSMIFGGSSELAMVDPAQAIAIAEQVTANNGDLSGLTQVQRKVYYLAMCVRYGLDPWSNPFDYLESKGKDGQKVTLYPNIKAANAWADKKGISCEIVSRSIDVSGREEGRYGSYEVGWATVEVRVSRGDRTLTEVGMVEIGSRHNRADALKKAITQARRRALLAFCGWGDGGEGTVSADNYDPPIDAVDLTAVNTQAPEFEIEALAASDSGAMEPLTPSTTQILSKKGRKNGWTRPAVQAYLSRTFAVLTMAEVLNKDYAEVDAAMGNPELAQAWISAIQEVVEPELVEA